jgi:hypothetical protein
MCRRKCRSFDGDKVIEANELLPVGAGRFPDDFYTEPRLWMHFSKSLSGGSECKFFFGFGDRGASTYSLNDKNFAGHG